VFESCFCATSAVVFSGDSAEYWDGTLDCHLKFCEQRRVIDQPPDLCGVQLAIDLVCEQATSIKRSCNASLFDVR
jgi:hypothetical protein